MVEIRIASLAKSFGAFEALRGIDLVIPSRSYACLLGPSGCGKSTLMRIIAGLEPPTAGDILFDGQRVNDLGSVERDVALAFQNYALYPHLDVADNLRFPLRAPVRRHLYTPEVIEERVREVSGLLRIDHLLGRSVNQLSGGQQQRVALGRALVRRPRVLLLDEPVTHLDARLRYEMRSELKRLHAAMGTTTIHVTHDQQEALAMSDLTIVMRSGRIEQVGGPMRIYHEPETAFVAGFIGDPPRTMLSGTTAGGDNGPVLRVGDASVPLPASLSAAVGPGGREVTLALPARATAIAGPHASSALAAVVDAHEMADRKQRIVFRLADQRIHFETDKPMRVRNGDKVPLTLGMEELRLYDGATGAFLAAAGGETAIRTEAGT